MTEKIMSVKQLLNARNKADWAQAILIDTALAFARIASLMTESTEAHFIPLGGDIYRKVVKLLAALPKDVFEGLED